MSTMNDYSNNQELTFRSKPNKLIELNFKNENKKVQKLSTPN